MYDTQTGQTAVYYIFVRVMVASLVIWADGETQKVAWL